MFFFFTFSLLHTLNHQMSANQVILSKNSFFNFLPQKSTILAEKIDLMVVFDTPNPQYRLFSDKPNYHMH